MTVTKELRIQLINTGNVQSYYPGDILKGQVILNLKKPIDVQYISINFQGIVEGVDNRVTLINKTELLSQPKNGQKYIPLDNKQQHTFGFEFPIPTDQRLPSSVDIPRIGRIAYYLTAAHKKPRFKLSPTLPNVTEQVEIMDIINIALPDYRIPVNMKTDLGFIGGGKLTQWNCSIPKSAFVRGDTITFECDMDNFPPMERKKAIKVSLLRQVHRTSTAKIIECKELSSKTIDLHIGSASPASQSALLNLDIPPNTPPSVFPDTGRTLSVSYLIQAELNMKGIKSAIKFKSSYTQEISIVIGTFPNSMIQTTPCNNYPSAYNGGSPVISQSPNPSRISLQSLAMENNSHILLPLDSSSQSIRSFSRSPNNIDRRTSSASLSTIIGPGRRNPLQQQRSFASANDDIKPLARLDDTEELQLSKSYLPRYRTPSSLSVVSSPSLLSPKSLVPRTKPSVPLFESSISSYQEAFDDYIPVTPLRKLENQHSTKLSSRIVDRTQGPIKKSSPPIIDQLLTPLPPIKAENEPYYHVGSNTAHHKSANRPLCLSPNSFNQDVHFLESSPHEIGPEDVINRQGTEKPIKPNNYYNTEAGRQSVPGTPPGLLHRQDTVSTASSAGLVDYPFTDMNPYHHG